MLDSNDLHEQDSPDHSTHPQTPQQHFGKRQTAFLKEKRSFQEWREALREQHSFLDEYRQAFVEARQLLWNRRKQQLLETGAFDQGGFQQRLEDYQEFEDFIRRQQGIFQQLRLAFQQRLATLHDRQIILHELGRDSQHWQQDYRQLRAAYQQLKEELREELEIIREQRAAYRQLQSNALFQESQSFSTFSSFLKR